MNEGLSGHCLCGAERFEGGFNPQSAMHCCCAGCRKSSGTGQCTYATVAEDAFMVTSEVLFSKNSGWPGMIFARASFLDSPEAIRPRAVFYADRATSRDTLDERITSFAETAGG